MTGAALRRHPLAGLMVLALALRTWAAATPGFHHPDAIYQYLEPAHRLLTGDGAVTWEWRVGMRSWLLPVLLAGPTWLGERIAPYSELAITLPRIVMGGASLGIVWAAWTIGDRYSRTHAVLAGFVATTWFEFVYFGTQTLAEPLAATAVLPAAALLTTPRPTSRQIGAAGALLAFAILLRPHYGPSCVALVAVAGWRDWRRWTVPLLIGGMVVALGSAAVDLAAGATPFAWMVENIRQNIVERRAAHYGIAPPLAYIAWFLALWRWWTVPLLIGVRFGWRRSPVLVVMALVTIAVHSLIGHKEDRFVFLATAGLVVVAAIGWADIARRLQERWPRLRSPWIVTGIAAAWAAASLSLVTGPTMAGSVAEGRAGSILAAAIRADHASCGVAVVDGATFADLPGTVALRRDMPVTILAGNDPAFAGASATTVATRWGAGFNRIVIPAHTALPPGYRVDRCEPWDDGELCVARRTGSCTVAARSPFAFNRSLARLGF